MKTTVLLKFLFLLTITVMGACKDKEPQYEIYENHEISACGVEDPLRNLDWLAEINEKYRITNPKSAFYYDARVELYSNLETHEEYVVVFIIPKEEKLTAPAYLPNWYQIYSCSGERLFMVVIDNSEYVNGEEWNEFFYSGKNKSQGVIAYRYMKIKK